MTASTGPEARVRELGLRIPDYTDPPYGGRYGNMKAFHRSGDLLLLSGMTGESRTGEVLHPGRVGADLSVEQGHASARLAAINTLGLLRLAVGSLDNVASVARNLCFIVCTPEFEDLHVVSEGAAQVYTDVFGPEAGTAGRAAIGVMSLSRRNCVELWLTAEVRNP
jgi:enamine deaminase RidA (YjgF/YER057c/UK114 family)